MCGAHLVRHVCRSVYSSKPVNLRFGSPLSSLSIRVASETALACCFLRLEGSICPLRVGAGNTQAPPDAFVRRMSKMACTFGVIGMRRRALPVLPKWISRLPSTAFAGFSRKHSSGRRAQSNRIRATSARSRGSACCSIASERDARKYRSVNLGSQRNVGSGSMTYGCQCATSARRVQ